MSNMPSGGDLGSAGRTTTGSTAQQVKDTVRDTTNRLAGAAKEKVNDAYEQKKGIVFDEVTSLANVLREAGEKLRGENSGSFAAQLTDRVAERLESVGDLGEKDLNQIVRDVENFGRRNPAVFLGVAAALGFVAIRFVKSSAKPDFNEEWTQSSGERSDFASPRSPLVSHAEDV
jgi:ElaB/YqjD/DUF883 family membrane-anchored ribosome-binding protein